MDNIVDLNPQIHKRVDSSFVDISKDSSEVLSKEEKELNQTLQEEAFGGGSLDPSTAKEKAAAITALNNAQAVLEASVLNITEKGETIADQKQFFKITEPLTKPQDVAPAALEVQAADNMVAEAASEDPDGVGALSDKELLFTADDRAKFDLETEILNKTNKLIGDQNIVRTVWQIGQRIIPFVQSYKDWSASKEGTAHILPTEVRKNQRAKFQYAKEQMTPEQYGQFLNNEYDRLVKEGHDVFAIQEYFEDMFTYNSRFDDAMQVLDIFAVGKLVKGGNKISRALKAGNRTKAVEAVKEASTEDKLAHVIPSIAKPQEGPTQSLSAIVEASDNIEIANTKALEAIQDTMIFEREINPKAKKKYIDVAAYEILKRFPKTEKKVLDTNLYTVERAADGTHDMIVTLGGGIEGTTPFTSEEAARAYIGYQTNFLKGEYDVVRSGEGYFVKVRTKVPNTGLIIDPKAYKEEGKPGKLKGLGRFFLGRIGTPKNLHAANNVAVRSVARLKQIANDMYKPIDSLRGADEKAFEVLKAKQLNETKWYKADELKDLGYSDKVIEANNAYKDINEIQYLIENNALRRDLNDLGFKHIKARDNDAGFLGKVEGSVKDFTSSTFKDADTGRVYNIGDMTAEEMERLTKEGKMFIRSASQEVDMTDRIPIKYHIVDRKTASVNELPMFMIENVPGGRRFYAKGTMFAKLPRTTNLNGKKVILKPKTLFAGLDKTSMTKKVDEINAALEEFTKYTRKELTRQELNERLGSLAATAKYFKAANLKELRASLGGNIDPLLRVEIVEDGQSLAQVNKMMAEKVASLVDDQLYFSSSMYDLIEANAQGYFKRGTPLKDVDGSLSATLSAKDSAKRTLDKLINTYTLDEYNKMYATEFKRLFGDVLNPEDVAKMSDIDLLRGGHFIDLAEATKNKALRNKINAAKHMQYKWQAITEQSTAWDKMVTTHMNNLAQKMAEWFPESFGRGSKRYSTISEFKADRSFMGLTFHAFLGSFNPKQLFTQAIGTVNVIALETKNGLKAAAMYPALRMAMSVDDTNTLNLIAKGCYRLTGTSAEEFKDMVTALKKIGAYNAEDVQLFLHSRSILDADNFKRASTFFFREGERFNMVTAQAASYLKHKEILGRAPKSYEELKDVLAYGEELYLNMSRASVTPLQKGTVLPTQLVAQFTAYPIRFLEAMFNKEFTNWQRAKLFFSNVALFGVGGALGRESTLWAIEKGKQLMGIDEPVTGEQVFVNGWLTEGLQAIGLDVNLSSYGPGILDKPWQLLAEHEMQLPAIAGLGAAWNTLAGISRILWPDDTNDTDLVNAMLYFSSERTLPVLRNATRGLLAYSTGKLYTSEHELLKDNVSSFEAVLYGLGFKPNDEQVFSDAVQYIIEKDKTLDDATKDLEKAYNKWIRTGTDTDLKEFTMLSRAIEQSLPDSWKSAFRKRRKTIYGKFPKIPLLDKEQVRALKAGDIELYEFIKENK